MRGHYKEVLIVFLGLWWWAVGQERSLDRQVRALCAKDGGVKVYETITLPAELVDKYGVIRIPTKAMVKPLDEYYYESEIHYFSLKDPQMWRLHFRVYRRSDGKLLGEARSYARRGGGFYGPWHESSFGCPSQSDISDLENKIFIEKGLGVPHESN